MGPGQPSSLALGPAQGRVGPLQPRRSAPTVGAPSLLELLDLLQAQPRALVDTEVAQHLLYRLCVRVLHGCGGPAGLASRPRGLLASASHSDRGLVPPPAPRRGLASPPPPPAASASRVAESPRVPSRRQLPLSLPGPRRRPLRAQLDGRCSRLFSSEGRISFALNRPPGAQAAAPNPPPRSPEVIRGPARTGGGGARPTPEGGTERGLQAGGVVRSALALFHSTPHPRQQRRKLRRRRRRWRRGRLRGDCSNSIYPPLPPLSPPPRHVDAAHWPREPSAARAARPRPLLGSLPPARLAPTLPRRPRPSRAPPPGTRIEAAVRRARTVCAAAVG